MHHATRNDVDKLIHDPLSFATMMDAHQLEQVIVAFVSVLNKRKPNRGD